MYEFYCCWWYGWCVKVVEPLTIYHITPSTTKKAVAYSRSRTLGLGTKPPRWGLMPWCTQTTKRYDTINPQHEWMNKYREYFLGTQIYASLESSAVAAVWMWEETSHGANIICHLFILPPYHHDVCVESLVVHLILSDLLPHPQK